MHIYAQRTNKHLTDSPPNLSKSRSLQSLHESTPRQREEKKRREPERQPRARQQLSTTNDSPPKKIIPKKEPNEPKSSTTQNGKTLFTASCVVERFLHSILSLNNRSLTTERQTSSSTFINSKEC